MARYVDVDAVIEVQMYDEEHEDFYTEKMTVEDYICRYSEMPSVIDAEPVRHGKWMGTVCSACGESTSNYYDCDYCPHCGARMGEE